jgi:mono/diheme cytochrome c family protein
MYKWMSGLCLLALALTFVQIIGCRRQVEIPEITASTMLAPEVIGNARKGQALFLDKSCAGCHKARGRGEASGPSLDVKSGKLQIQDLLDTIQDLWNHLPEMSRAIQEKGIERPVLSSRETRDILAYIHGPARTAPQLVLTDRTAIPVSAIGDPAKGAQLFVEKECHRCHMVHGIGERDSYSLDFLRINPSVTLFADLGAMLWEHWPHMEEAAREHGIVLHQLQGRELHDIAAFIYAPRYTPSSQASHHRAYAKSQEPL